MHVFYQCLKEAKENSKENSNGHYDSKSGEIKKFRDKYNQWLEQNKNANHSLIFNNKNENQLEKTDDALEFLMCIHYIGESEFKKHNCYGLIQGLKNSGILKEKNKKNSFQFNFSGRILKEKLNKELDPNDANRVWDFVEQYHYYDLSQINFNKLNCKDYEFNYFVKFSNCNFYDFTCFKQVTFKKGVSFDGSTFHGGVNFWFSTFSNKESISLSAVTFKRKVDLSFTTFKNVNNICFMEFKTEDLFIFEYVKDKEEINSTFNFDKATINGTFSFDVNTNNCVDFSKANITGGGIMIADRDSWRKLPTVWDDIIATVTHIFQNIKAKAKSLTINLIPKIWPNCWLPSKSKYDCFSHDKGPEKYVFLKSYYKNQGDVKRELEYSFMELEAEYQRLSWVCFSKEFPFFITARKIPFFFYRWFSLYGSSIIRPLIWILIFLLLSELFNNGLDLFANLRSLSWLKTTAILNKLSIIFPILNIESAEINNVPDALLSLVSIPLLFLFGLGLRNRFKLR